MKVHIDNKQLSKEEVKKAKKLAARRFKGFSTKVKDFKSLGKLSNIFNS